jgi:transient receptor potential cation channel subfamily C
VCQAVMRDLIKRYIMHQQRKRQGGEGVTEDDMNELKQDISSFRFELLEILRNNGMKTPNPNQPKPTSKKLRYWRALAGASVSSFDSSKSFSDLES